MRIDLHGMHVIQCLCQVLYSITVHLQGDCCAACESLDTCNIWVWCASYGGCKYGTDGVFPMYGCDLKHQDNYTDMSQLPLAYSRGPPTPFTSGACTMPCLQCHHASLSLVTHMMRALFAFVVCASVQRNFQVLVTSHCKPHRTQSPFA